MLLAVRHPRSFATNRFHQKKIDLPNVINLKKTHFLSWSISLTQRGFTSRRQKAEEDALSKEYPRNEHQQSSQISPEGYAFEDLSPIEAEKLPWDEVKKRMREGRAKGHLRELSERFALNLKDEGGTPKEFSDIIQAILDTNNHWSLPDGGTWLRNMLREDFLNFLEGKEVERHLEAGPDIMNTIMNIDRWIRKFELHYNFARDEDVAELIMLYIKPYEERNRLDPTYEIPKDIKFLRKYYLPHSETIRSRVLRIIKENAIKRGGYVLVLPRINADFPRRHENSIARVWAKHFLSPPIALEFRHEYTIKSDIN